MSAILDQVRSLLEACREAAPTEASRVDDALARLEQPLRVAVAGKIKAGKSTLLNALVGQPLAPTDAGECTTIVTWYRDGATYRVTLHPESGQARTAPFRQGDGARHRVDGPGGAVRVGPKRGGNGGHVGRFRWRRAPSPTSAAATTNRNVGLFSTLFRDVRILLIHFCETGAVHNLAELYPG